MLIRRFLSTRLAAETSWISRYGNATQRELGDDEEATALSALANLPEDLFKIILTYLPVESIIIASSVCKRWHNVVTSKSFKFNLSNVPPQKPWYFMFTSSGTNVPMGYAYDPIFQKWNKIQLPFIRSRNFVVASSSGLVCFQSNGSKIDELRVCNPITKACRKIKKPPPGLRYSDYNALALSVNRESHCYSVAIVKSRYCTGTGNFFQCNISICIYNSEQVTWTVPLAEELMGWRGGDESVICNGVLYFLVYSIGGGQPENRHGLIEYNMANPSSLATGLITVPFTLTCGRLMNLKEKLVMVGGIATPDQPSIITGIGIWVLNDRSWEEIARMPEELFFQSFGEFDDTFESRGADDLIYIQCYEAPVLVIFDMNNGRWKWSPKCHVPKLHTLHLFACFSLEPRLEMEP
ncbi:hypothetical protein RIF29_24127 [Crotalaria pallida]|uniref:F-box domain-containing protein n=1 Tax=Crotalaria pallida TaxID=3830 RepID=A0AAN9HY61_CROPI